MSGGEWEVAEIGRLLHTHRLDQTLARPAPGIEPAQARCLADAGDMPARAADHPHHAALLLNILVRLEMRCRHDSRAVAAALKQPVPEPDDPPTSDRAASSQLMSNGPSASRWHGNAAAAQGEDVAGA